MVSLAKKAPGSALGHTWAKAGDVVEVPESHAAELLAVGHAGFYVSHAPAPEPESAPEDEAPQDSEEFSEESPRRRARRAANEA